MGIYAVRDIIGTINKGPRLTIRRANLKNLKRKWGNSMEIMIWAVVLVITLLLEYTSYCFGGALGIMVFLPKLTLLVYLLGLQLNGQ